MMRFEKWLEFQWYRKHLSASLLLLVPFSALYRILISIRRFCYLKGWFKQYKFSVPVIIIGNLTVGGTGKTPLVIYVAKLLAQRGLRPGIVSRGYKGQCRHPTWVSANSDPHLMGDEPVLLAKRLFCPIVVGKNRPLAVQQLINSNQVDVIISDDGLQHYALARDIEIMVIDGKRRFGNGYCLPAGPLREPMGRALGVDYRVTNTPLSFDQDSEYEMELRPRTLYNGKDAGIQKPLGSFQNQRLHAVAGIGFPDRFFELLQNHGLLIIPHPFPDHYDFKPEDLDFKDDLPVIMTEKDAVKCAELMTEKHWVLSVDAVVNPLLDLHLITRLEELKRG